MRILSTHSAGRRARRALPVIAALALAAPAEGQRTLGTIGRDIRNAGSDILYVWSSPVRAGAGDWLAAGGVLVAGAAVSPWDDDVDRWVVRSPDAGLIRAARPFREQKGTNLGDLPTGRLILPISGALYVAGFAADQPGLRDAALGCLASQQANSTARHLLYEVVARDRPSVRPASEGGDQYRFDVPGGEWERHSFFGGHVANAVACVTFFNERFELGPVEPVLMVFAAGIIVARSADRRHWVSDNLIGGAFGYAVGRTVARRSLARARESDDGRRGAGEAMAAPRAAPLVGTGPGGTRLGLELRF